MALEKNNLLAPGALNKIINQHLSPEGVITITTLQKCCAKVRFGRVLRTCNAEATEDSNYCCLHIPDTKKNEKPKELEYMELRGQEYYYYPGDCSVFTYSSKPEYIGKFDLETDSIIVT